jgi:signal transduction histidine kinase
MTAEPVTTEHLHALAQLQSLSSKLNVSLSLEETLDAIIEAALAICRADRAAISYLNDAGELQIMRQRGLSDEYINRRRLTRLDPAIKEMIARRQPLVIEDVNALAGRSPNYNAWKSEGVASIITLPLVSEGDTFGVIGAGSSVSRRYSQTEVDAMAVLAAQAGAAITNARLYERLRDANRAKDEFLSTLSHELRTPLTPILGWMHLLKPFSKQEKVLAEGLETIERNANQLAGLIRDLLDMTRIESGKVELSPRPTDLGALVRSQVAQTFLQAEARGITVDSSLTEEVFIIEIDPVRIEQAIANLLNNAVKFTPEGGRIFVSLGRGASDEAVIEVADTGIGIEPEFLPHVFDRFSQGHSGMNRRYGGLGLGLAITRAMVEMHGGQVTAKSDGPGLGSRFVVRLPAEKAMRERDANDREPAGEPIRIEPLGLRVLVIEDSEDTLNMLKLWLDAFGCEVVTATDAARGEALAISHAPDLILSDIGMPDVDGYQLMRRLRKNTGLERVPAIALTGYARDEDRDQARAAGYDAHISKPADINKLIGLIKKLTKR